MTIGGAGGLGEAPEDYPTLQCAEVKNESGIDAMARSERSQMTAAMTHCGSGTSSRRRDREYVHWRLHSGGPEIDVSAPPSTILRHSFDKYMVAPMPPRVTLWRCAWSLRWGRVWSRAPIGVAHHSGCADGATSVTAPKK